jgi:hypothetical protein
MIPLVLLLLMTASQSVDLGDEFYQIPRDEWRFVPIFSSNLSPPVTGISRERQLAVVLISFAVFFGIVTVSARQLWRAIRR